MDGQTRSGRNSRQPEVKREFFFSENVPDAFLYFIDILIKTGALFGELCSEVEITLICCPCIKAEMNGSLGSSYVSWYLAILSHKAL